MVEEYILSYNKSDDKISIRGVVDTEHSDDNNLRLRSATKVYHRHNPYREYPEAVETDSDWKCVYRLIDAYLDDKPADDETFVFACSELKAIRDRRHQEEKKKTEAFLGPKTTPKLVEMGDGKTKTLLVTDDGTYTIEFKGTILITPFVFMDTHKSTRTSGDFYGVDLTCTEILKNGIALAGRKGLVFNRIERYINDMPTNYRFTYVCDEIKAMRAAMPKPNEYGIRPYFVRYDKYGAPWKLPLDLAVRSTENGTTETIVWYSNCNGYNEEYPDEEEMFCLERPINRYSYILEMKAWKPYLRHPDENHQTLFATREIRNCDYFW